MQTMQKISYINQMNGFLDRMSEDTLPANAVMLYLMLFKSFNRTCWRQEWLKFTIQQLMIFANAGSPNTVYNMRCLLKEQGYIDYRPAQNGNRSQTEYRLLPMPGNAATSFSPNEHSVSEYSKTEHSAEFSVEYSLSENKTENSPIGEEEEEEKKRKEILPTLLQ